MDINSETFKDPKTWAVLTPALLLLAALYMTLGMLDAKQTSHKNDVRAGKVVKTAGEIIQLRRQTMAQGITQQKVRPYDTVNSVLESAAAAGISENKIFRGSSPTAKKLKDGSSQYRENYKINHVMMYQIASFVDYAERNFESLRCMDITIVPSPDLKNKDSWDANINYIYTRK